MFNFSSKTIINKEFKLSDILKQIHADKDVRVDAGKINKIKLSNVINASTFNSDEECVIKEIYIFELELNRKEVPALFLKELDKSIMFQTFFICRFGDEVYTQITYKVIDKKVNLDNRTYSHNFHQDDEIPIPRIDNVQLAYKFLLEYEVGVPGRHSEIPDEYMQRVKEIHKLDFQIGKTEMAIVHETQPKLKFKYNANLRKYKKQKEELMKAEE